MPELNIDYLNLCAKTDATLDVKHKKQEGAKSALEEVTTCRCEEKGGGT